jgi:hypothetical protein
VHGADVTEVFLAAACSGELLTARATCAYVVWEKGIRVDEFSARIPSFYGEFRVPLTRIIAEVAALYFFTETYRFAGADILIRTESRFLIDMLTGRRPAGFAVTRTKDLGLGGAFRGIDFWNAVHNLNDMLNVMLYRLAIDVDPLTGLAQARRRMPAKPGDRVEGRFFAGRPRSVEVRAVKPTQNLHAGRLAKAAFARAEDAGFFSGAQAGK